jgi:uncharacterized protein DUF4136
MKKMILGLALLGMVSGCASAMPKYGIKVRSDKRTDFTKLRTYVSTAGWSAYDSAVDRQITSAIERELAALGLTRRESEPSDAVATYASISRTDVDVKSKQSPVTGLRREYPVGTLVVLLLEPGSRRELFRGRIDMPLEREPSKLAAQIDTSIARVFAKYPTRKSVRQP